MLITEKLGEKRMVKILSSLNLCLQLIILVLVTLISACSSDNASKLNTVSLNLQQNPVELNPVNDLLGKVIIERDVGIYTRDNTRLSAKIYRPNKKGKFPVIMSFTAYGKDFGPEDYPSVLDHNAKPDFDLGPIKVSKWTAWEAPDPAFWVLNDYIVMYVDSRGYFGSEGKPSILSDKDSLDFYDAIRWAGQQSWSNGNVGLNGVSYLAISQWLAATSRPPNLKAIIPWEGQTDPYRETLYHGGIPETAFTNFWVQKINTGASANVGPPPFLFKFVHKRPWLFKLIQDTSALDLTMINIPVLIAASWSDHGLHSRGSFEAFKRISSIDKWLFTHGRPKWSTYYSDEALAFQKQFFDHYLKGKENKLNSKKPVRLEVRHSLTQYHVRFEESWPIPRTEYRRLFLDADNRILRPSPITKSGKVDYPAQTGSAIFSIVFDRDTEISGNMKLKLWLSTDQGTDMDIFVAVKKSDVHGDDVPFYAKTGYNKGPVALGWLRVSQRELDRKKSTPWQPILTHENPQTLSENEIVAVEIEILPSSTLFKKGETLNLVIQGHDIFSHPTLAHAYNENKGIHSIYTGKQYDSHLLIPVIPPDAM
ncbi:CocE/NonD family hydrolase [Thalassotalea sp. PS06]|uniref:CocE/NonD family hydrolase n=1 Tax=Thalassotalea sp. PS06 TaxID=2594005 RepID=UPI001163CE5D|nr:CocE/NonD family hydrolase [Thalassotalea sp. PS06]QDP02362.1 CocE/NonD family hydrolase [Thalassotalea sp. PS06]